MDAKAGFFLKTKVKQKPVVPEGTTGFLELLGGFEPLTSSLPKAIYTKNRRKTIKNHNKRGIQTGSYALPSPCPAGHESDGFPGGNPWSGTHLIPRLAAGHIAHPGPVRGGPPCLNASSNTP